MIDRCKIPDEITKYWPPHLKDNNRENMTRPGFFATKTPIRYSFNEHWEDLVMGRGAYGPAIRPQDRRMFQDVPENTIFYSYVPQCEDDMQEAFKQIDRWEAFCEPKEKQVAVEHCQHIQNQGRSNGKTPIMEVPYTEPSQGQGAGVIEK